MPTTYGPSGKGGDGALRAAASGGDDSGGQIEIRDERGRLLCTSRLTMAVLKHKRDKDSGEA